MYHEDYSLPMTRRAGWAEMAALEADPRLGGAHPAIDRDKAARAYAKYLKKSKTKKAKSKSPTKSKAKSPKTHRNVMKPVKSIVHHVVRGKIAKGPNKGKPRKAQARFHYSVWGSRMRGVMTQTGEGQMKLTGHNATSAARKVVRRMAGAGEHHFILTQHVSNSKGVSGTRVYMYRGSLKKLKTPLEFDVVGRKGKKKGKVTTRVVNEEANVILNRRFTVPFTHHKQLIPIAQKVIDSGRPVAYILARSKALLGIESPKKKSTAPKKKKTVKSGGSEVQEPFYGGSETPEPFSGGYDDGDDYVFGGSAGSDFYDVEPRFGGGRARVRPSMYEHAAAEPISRAGGAYDTRYF